MAAPSLATKDALEGLVSAGSFELGNDVVVVVVTELGGAARSESFISDEQGRFRFPRPSFDFAVAAAHPRGFAFVPKIDHNIHDLKINLSSICVPTHGVLIGDDLPPLAKTDVLRLSAYSPNTGDTFGAVLGQDKTFSICLPPGAYKPKLPPQYALQDTIEYIPTKNMAIRVAPYSQVSSPPSRQGLVASEDVSDILSSLRGISLIGLGETNHGTREFASERSRITTELFQNLGFKQLLLEVGYGESIQLDEYVNGANLDIRTVLSRLGYWTWNTHEFLESLTQIRDFNQRLKRRDPNADPVRVIGIDIQTSRDALAILAKSSELHLSGLPYGSIDSVASSSLSSELDLRKLPDDARVGLRQDLNKLATQGGSDSTDRIKLAAQSLLFHLDYIEVDTVDAVKAMQLRDLFMSKMALAALGSPNRASVLWAHLGHIAREVTVGAPSMGNHLAKALGDRYRVYAIVGLQGSVRARVRAEGNKISTATLNQPAVTTLETVLASKARAGQASWFEFRHATGSYAAWLRGLHYVRSFGAVYTGLEEELSLFDLSTFDGALFVESMSPTNIIK